MLSQGVDYFAMILGEKKKSIKRNKKFMLILLTVMTSHRKIMMIKSCWELADIALVIVAINRK